MSEYVNLTVQITNEELLDYAVDHIDSEDLLVEIFKRNIIDEYELAKIISDNAYEIDSKLVKELIV